MNKVIFLFFAITVLPLCAMDVTLQSQDDATGEFALWQLKKVVELWPDLIKKELPDSEKVHILSEFQLPHPKKDTSDYSDYENSFCAYLNNAIIHGSAYRNIARKDFLKLRSTVGSLLNEVEQKCNEKLGPHDAHKATPEEYAQANEIALEYQPRLLEVLKDIKNPHEVVETKTLPDSQ